MTISKDMFLSHLYGGMDEPELKIIDVFMCKLRKKLAAVSCGTEYVETRGGAGLHAPRAPVLQRDRLARCWSGSSSCRGQ